MKETPTYTIEECAKYCAKIVNGNGPHSFGGAILFQHHCSQLRSDPKGIDALKKLKMTDDDIQYILNFTIQA